MRNTSKGLKKVVIFTVSSDYNTIETVAYLRTSGIFPVIINEHHQITTVNIILNNSKKTVRIETSTKQLVEIDGNTILWYRSGQNFITPPSFTKKSRGIKQALEMEFKQFQDGFFYVIESICKFKIGSYFSKDINKINTLSIANSLGIFIPHTSVLLGQTAVFEKNKQYITKSIHEIVQYYKNGKTYANKTTVVKSLTNYDIHFPTLFQENISKRYEIRTFYFFKKTYSMAIFSQSNRRTKEDYRNYDYEKPNRTVPYIIDPVTEKKIIRLMKALKLDVGSLDFIVNDQEELIFLEVNPIGQYGMVSIPCHYNLDQVIAQKIIDAYEK